MKLNQLCLGFLGVLITSFVACAQDDRPAYDQSLIQEVCALVPHPESLTDVQVDSLDALIRRWGHHKYHQATLRDQYVKQAPSNVSFLELPYKELDDNTFDFGYRLLGVARFWNLITYYSPNKALTDTPWDKVLPLFIKKAADTTLTTYELFAELSQTLNDTHAMGSHYSELAGGRIVPIVATFAQERLIVTDTCTLGGNPLQPGDEITSLDGVAPKDKIETVARFNSFSNQAALYCHASYMVLYTPNESVTVGFIPKGSKRSKKATIATVERSAFGPYIGEKLYPEKGPSYRFISDSVAYVFTGSLTSKNCDTVYTRIENTKRLIIDLRTYPPDFGIMANFFGFYLVKDPAPFVSFAKPIATQPQQFTHFTQNNATEANPDAYKGQIIVLVNAQTLSMAEFFTMCLQSIPGTLTVGSTTAGADGNVSRVMLPYNFGFAITGLGVCYPDGTNAQRAGVKIDVFVEPTVQGLIDGRDEVLEAAIALP